LSRTKRRGKGNVTPCPCAFERKVDSGGREKSYYSVPAKSSKRIKQQGKKLVFFCRVLTSQNWVRTPTSTQSSESKKSHGPTPSSRPPIPKTPWGRSSASEKAKTTPWRSLAVRIREFEREGPALVNKIQGALQRQPEPAKGKIFQKYGEKYQRIPFLNQGYWKGALAQVHKFGGQGSKSSKKLKEKYVK